MPCKPKKRDEQKILIDRFLVLRSLMEDAGMIIWEVDKKGNNSLIVNFDMALLESTYPDKKRAIFLGRKAKDELIMSMSGAVHKLASYYLLKRKLNKSYYEDLTQMGFAGVTYSLYKFDPNAGTLFSTYAYQWINARIERGSRSTYLIKADIKKVDKETGKAIYPDYPFQFYTHTRDGDGNYVDILDTIADEDNDSLVDKIHNTLNPEEIDIVVNVDTQSQKTRKTKNSPMGILEAALFHDVPLDNFYDQRQAIIDKARELIDL